jgi:quercetin dioxygenase-like cupin family protein
MRCSMKKYQAILGVLVIAGALVTAPVSRTDAQDVAPQVKPVMTEKLPNVPGKNISAVLVTYPPSGKSAKHHHAGSVFVYVLSGAIRSETSATGPVRVYQAGDNFFEPPGSEHLISENASPIEPASLLAVFVADDGAQLTTVDK